MAAAVRRGQQAGESARVLWTPTVYEPPSAEEMCAARLRAVRERAAECPLLAGELEAAAQQLQGRVVVQVGFGIRAHPHLYAGQDNNLK
jgi:hypothetical protein